ncbi:MAG: hypothetical protein PHO76_02645 [Methylotenera sp.]|nr:hypothetical protein [Methylotenera sp.]MDD4927242.1 hypothetical protein [Methylotenera sp.]
MANHIESLRSKGGEFSISVYEPELIAWRSGELLGCIQIFSGCSSGHYHLTKTELESLRGAIDKQIASFESVANDA